MSINHKGAWLVLVGICGLTAWFLLPPPNTATVNAISPPPAPTRPKRITPMQQRTLRILHKRLHQRLSLSILKGPKAWRRTDGFVYSIDVGRLLLYAAKGHHQTLYAKLAHFAKTHLVLIKQDDPYTRGFVLWRYAPNKAKDATGTTEALVIARGLWHGGKWPENKRDKDTAITILDGYRRHQTVENGIWLIRNYFNLKTRGFATNSFTIDYLPDFVKTVARATHKQTHKELADKSFRLLDKAVAPSGLFYSVIQPEVSTFLHKRLSIYAPNGVVKLLNSLIIAERIARHRPWQSRRVLGWAVYRLPRLNGFYNAQTGHPAMRQQVGPATYATMIRLAIKLNQRDAFARILPYFLSEAINFVQYPHEPTLYIHGQLLLALQDSLTFLKHIP
jgi:hypothetical protein